MIKYLYAILSPVIKPFRGALYLCKQRLENVKNFTPKIIFVWYYNNSAVFVVLVASERLFQRTAAWHQNFCHQ